MPGKQSMKFGRRLLFFRTFLTHSLALFVCCARLRCVCSPHSEQNRLLGGPIALLKAHASQVFEFCAREAAQIFGGLAYTRGGQGADQTHRCRAHARLGRAPAPLRSAPSPVSSETLCPFSHCSISLRPCSLRLPLLVSPCCCCPGDKVERLYREVRAYAIPAGSEEIMLDLGIRQAIKGAAKNFKSKM